MKPYDMSGEFVDEACESSLVAAIAAQPDLFFELGDGLPDPVFHAVRPTWVAVREAIEAGGSPVVPDGIQPHADPAGAAARLLELYQARLFADLLQRMSAGLFKARLGVADLVAQVEHDLGRIQTAARELRAGHLEFAPSLFAEILADLQARWQARQETGSIATGIETGFPGLDSMLGGLQTGIYLVAGHPGVGKTSLILQISGHASAKGVPVVYVTFDEAPRRLVLKAVCQAAGLVSKRYWDADANPDEIVQAMNKVGANLARLGVVEGAGKLTVAHVKGKALAAMKRTGAKRCLIVVDYTQRWSSGAANGQYEQFRHQVGGLVAQLRELALRLDCPVIAVSSQNRAGEGKALMTSLKESGDLEYCADAALFLVEGDRERCRPPFKPVDLCIEKNRYGATGKIELDYRPDIGVLREVEE